MAARKRIWTPDVVRARIQAGQIVRRLQQFVMGAKDDQGLVIQMTPAQVTAALGLLKKTVPDLSAIEHTGSITHKHVQDLTDAELLAIARGRSEGVIEASPSEAEPPELH